MSNANGFDREAEWRCRGCSRVIFTGIRLCEDLIPPLCGNCGGKMDLVSVAPERKEAPID